LFIIAEILNIAGEGSLKTQIMYRANLSFAQLNEYLSLLLDLSLLEVGERRGKTIYKTTGKGLRYLQGYREISELLKEEQEGNNTNDANSLRLVKRGSQVICSKGPL
jgi:predicted transcriptional regulator